MTIDSINNKEEMESVSLDTIKFHGTFKSIARMLIKYLPFGNTNEEQYAPLLKGNARVFYEIIKEWQALDKRQHRKDILSKPLLIGTSVYFFNSDFREVLNFMMWRLIQRQGELVFPPHHLDPGTWCTGDGGDRVTPGCGVSHEAVIRHTGSMIILNQILPVRQYWITIEPEKARYYATNTNRPVWCGDGWGYKILGDYGTEEQFNQRIIMGDPI
jgi:hypothetical protein